ncbi:hypothetical protein PAECIP111892_01650 [Paenibacillus auburnensis]|uniref:Uncharacterized protein n=1 Tax=Paenibacillus auburnensis TaxID=2905649 RepID=A0ABN8FXN3_9BACL|nr:hypothetical protein PAECIP111892_01650 [Paenibacillus auburnensis]
MLCKGFSKLLTKTGFMPARQQRWSIQLQNSRIPRFRRRQRQEGYPEIDSWRTVARTGARRYPDSDHRRRSGGRGAKRPSGRDDERRSGRGSGIRLFLHGIFICWCSDACYSGYLSTSFFVKYYIPGFWEMCYCREESVITELPVPEHF